MTISPPSNITNSVGMFEWLNAQVGDFLFPGIILVTFLIIFMKQLMTPGNTAGKSFASASFLAMILSVMARLLGFVDTSFMIISIIFVSLGGIWMHVENN